MYCLRAEGSGVVTTNSCVAGSYVAVVRSDWTSDPWPVSVIAKHPSSSPDMIGRR